MQPVKFADPDYLGDHLASEHAVKRKRLNPPGDNMYLKGEQIISEIEVIKNLQRRFKEHYYSPDGPWFIKKFILKNTASNTEKVNDDCTACPRSSGSAVQA